MPEISPLSKNVWSKLESVVASLASRAVTFISKTDPISLAHDSFQNAPLGLLLNALASLCSISVLEWVNTKFLSPVTPVAP